VEVSGRAIDLSQPVFVLLAAVARGRAPAAW
jgi:hypothetical protein